MRPIEIISLVLLVISAFLLLTASHQRWRPRLLTLIAVVLLLFSILYYGERWQLWPAYTAALVLLLADWWKPANVWTRRGALALGLLLVTASGVCNYVLPAFRLPAPTGSYALGTHEVFLTDTSRTINGYARPIVAQIWYPAAPSGLPYAPYRKRSETSLLGSYQATLPTHSRQDAPVLAGQWPVVIYNPAWDGWRGQNTYLLEDLASHGFVVVGMEHAGNTGPFGTPDGRFFIPAQVPEVEHMGQGTLESLTQLLSHEVDDQVADCRQILDQMEKWNLDPSSPWAARLSLSRVGTVGYSVGGATAMELAAQDPRVRAPFNISGLVVGQALHSGWKGPAIFLHEEMPVLTHAERNGIPDADARVDMALDEQTWNALQRFAPEGSFDVTLTGANHASFGDKILASPLPKLSGATRQDWTEIPPMLRAYLVDWMLLQLKDEHSQLLTDPLNHFERMKVTKIVRLPETPTPVLLPDNGS